jgi:predicted aspartyl protease
MNSKGVASSHSILVILLIGAFHSQVCASDTPEVTGRVPFRIHEHLIIVQASIGDLRNLNFALDTGSTYTVLSKDLGRKLGLKGETVKVSAFGREVKMKKAFLKVLALSQVEFEHIEARLFNMPRVDGLRLDGLIGLDVLKRTTVTLDFEKGELLLGQPRQLPYNTRFYAGLTFIPVTMTVEGKALRLALDTAACGLVLYDGAVKDKFEIHQSHRFEYRGQVGGQVKMEEIFLMNVALEDALWEELPAYLMHRKQGGTESVMGNLGVISLGLKALQFDFETGQLGWEL